MQGEVRAGQWSRLEGGGFGCRTVRGSVIIQKAGKITEEYKQLGHISITHPLAALLGRSKENELEGWFCSCLSSELLLCRSVSLGLMGELFTYLVEY